MKKFLLLNFLILRMFSSLAQIPEMDWINTNQKYLKIEVNSSGVYRMSIEEIEKLFPEILVTKVNHLQLFHKGNSIAFDITSKNESPLKEDYIYFYGEKNVGRNESVFYRPETHQPNTYSSLYTDNSAYFLTINEKQLSRKQIALEKTKGKLQTIQDHEYENVEVFNSTFSFNSVTGPVPYLQQSFFENGEGYTGSILKEKTIYDYTIPYTDATSSEVELEIQLNGRDNNFNKQLRVTFGDAQSTFKFNEFQTNTVTLKQSINNSSGNLKLSVYGEGGSYSLNYIKTYYKKENIINSNNGNITISGLDQGIIKFKQNTPQGTRIWNISDPSNITEANFLNNQSYEISPLFAKNTYHHFSKYLTPSNITMLDFQTAKFNNKANYLIISSKKIKDGAESYTNFRQSSLGGNYTVETVFIEDLYNLFNYGIQNPLAIKNYLKYKFQTSKPSFLLLIGKAFSAYTGVNKSNDFVPSFGYPASDLLLSSGIITHQDVPGIATGRIPAMTNAEVFTYLEKIKQNLNLNPDISQKNTIHLSGGDSFSQIEEWASYMKDLKNIADNGDFGLNITSKNKQILDPREPANIVKNINDGVSLVSFLGHSAYQIVDLNIGFVSDPLLGYNNTRYPILYFNGCAFNNYFREIPTLSYDWLFTPNKGAVATIGQSYFGYPISLIKHAKVFYEKIFQSAVQPTIGEALKLTAEEFLKLSYNSEYDILHVHQTLLFGDPAIKIFGYNKPDLKLETATFNESTSKLFIKVSNLGKYKSGNSLPVRIILKNSIFKDTININTTVPKLADSLYIPIQSSSLYDEIDMSLDYNNLIDEDNENNNHLSLKLYEPAVFKDDKEPNILVLLEQQNPYNKMLVPTSPTFKINIIDDKSLSDKNKPSENFTIYLKSCESCQYVTLPINNYAYTLKSISKNNLELQISLNNLEPGFYEMAIVGKDSIGNSNRDKPYLLNFTVSTILSNTVETKTELKVYPNPSTKCLKFEWQEGASSHYNAHFKFLIYSLEGKLIHLWETDATDSSNFSIWCADKPGSYTYKIIDIKGNKPILITSGKIQVIE
jgi:hypothetical protein